jgi:hypothetical protein
MRRDEEQGEVDEGKWMRRRSGGRGGRGRKRESRGKRARKKYRRRGARERRNGG